MDKHTKRIRVMDSLLVYLLCLVLTLMINILLTPVIGIFARILSQVLVIAVVLLTMKRTGLSFKNTLPCKDYGIKTAIGSSAVLAGVVLLSVPCLLFFHLIAPNFAVTGFHVLEQSPSFAGYLWVALLVILSAVSNTLLFDGYLFSGFKYFDKKYTGAILCSVLYGVAFADLYVFLPLIIVECGIYYVRSVTQSVKLTFIMQLLAVSSAYAVLELSSENAYFWGENEGFAKILGMAMIFLGVSMLLLWVSTSLLNKRSSLTPFGKLMTVLLFIIFLAIGSGLASL